MPGRWLVVAGPAAAAGAMPPNPHPTEAQLRIEAIRQRILEPGGEGGGVGRGAGRGAGRGGARRGRGSGSGAAALRTSSLHTYNAAINDQRLQQSQS